METTELKKGQTYKIGSSYYTYRGTMNKGRKMIFWVRQDGPESPVENTIALTKRMYNEILAPYF